MIFTGDPDTNIFIVQSGKLRVYTTDCEGSQVPLKDVRRGESICSLLSFTDVLTGQPSVFKTVAAHALEESSVLRLPFSAFQEVFEDHPDALVRAVQVIMVRLQRVTFLALHQYLGLSAELVKSHHAKHHSGNMSPTKLRMREFNFTKQLPTHEAHELPDAETPTQTPPSSEGRRRVKEEKDYQQTLKNALEGFVSLLGLEDSSHLEGNFITFFTVP